MTDSNNSNSATEFKTVDKVGDIPDGEGRAFEIGEHVVAVFLLDGQYSAINDMCPHMGASLASGFLDKENCTVACPWHAWRFDVRDGTWADNRSIKTDVFKVRIQGDEIQVSVAANETTETQDTKEPNETNETNGSKD